VKVKKKIIMAAAHKKVPMKKFPARKK